MRTRKTAPLPPPNAAGLMSPSEVFTTEIGGLHHGWPLHVAGPGHVVAVISAATPRTDTAGSAPLLNKRNSTPPSPAHDVLGSYHGLTLTPVFQALSLLGVGGPW
jgi:hypothetical protein